MKLHYSKILLFPLSLNILVASSSYAHNKNKPYITPDTPTTTLRMLSECDLYMPNYDKNPDMKSVKENFDRQTSQRFEEYEKRMSKKRQKCKEQCNKDIQQIILKDKIEKSLEEKVEKCCLMCGCGLGVVATGVGIFGSLAVYELKKAALLAAKQAALLEGAAEGASQGAAAGVAEVVKLIESTFGIKNIVGQELGSIFNVTNYNNEIVISGSIQAEYMASNCSALGAVSENPICNFVTQKGLVSLEGQETVRVVALSDMDVIITAVKDIVKKGTTTAETIKTQVTLSKTAEFEGAKKIVIDATYASSQTAIIASVVVILVIVLVMAIIYLILRYRRKKKMKKKQQYTKLLNE
ncbi:rifin [Plasmodium sp. gorilla clade G1]|nr:rifin [Plasmodium sp. gorilla clade G1]